MRNLGKILLFVPLLILQSCHGDILPDDGTAPTAEFVKVSLVGDADMLSHDSTTRSVWADPKGSGRLRFNWEKVDEDSENINNLLFSISDGETVIPNTSAVNSALTVTPHERINNLAYFQTVSYYAADDLERAVANRTYAASPNQKPPMNQRQARLSPAG